MIQQVQASPVQGSNQGSPKKGCEDRLLRPRKVPYTNFQAEDKNQPFEPWVHRWGFERFDPTSAVPGSYAKKLILQERLVRGLPLWHPADPGVSYTALWTIQPSELTVRSRPVALKNPRGLGSSRPTRHPELTISPSTSQVQSPPQPLLSAGAPEPQKPTASPVVVAQDDDVCRMFQITRDGVGSGMLSPIALDEFLTAHGEALRSAGLVIEEAAQESPLPERAVDHYHQRPAASLFMPSDRPDVSTLAATLERMQRLVQSGALQASAIDEFRSQYGSYLRPQFGGRVAVFGRL